VRGWRATHRVFYDALRALGVTASKAKLMYYAVYLGGPKWIEIIPGDPCGPNCVFQVEVAQSGASASLEFDVAGGAGPAAELAIQSEESGGNAMTISRAADYDEPGFVEELQRVELLLDAAGDEIDLDYLERRAKERRPNDFFYANDSQIELESGFAFE